MCVVCVCECVSASSLCSAPTSIATASAPCARVVSRELVRTTHIARPTDRRQLLVAALIRTGQKKQRHPPPAAQARHSKTHPPPRHALYPQNKTSSETSSPAEQGNETLRSSPVSHDCPPSLSGSVAVLCIPRPTNKQTAPARLVDSATPLARSLATVLAGHDLARFTTALSCPAGLCRHGSLHRTLPCTACDSSSCQWHQSQRLHFAHRVRVLRIVSG